MIEHRGIRETFFLQSGGTRFTRGEREFEWRPDDVIESRRRPCTGWRH